MALLMILFAIAGLCVGSEYFMSNNSRWNRLAKKFGNPSTPPRGWQGCKFLRMEIQEGNRLRLTTYGHGYKKDALDILAAKMFPKVLVSVGPLGLYLKRQPWNFRHPQILIPGSRVTSTQSLAMSEFATQAAARRLPIPGLQFPKVPGVLAGVVDALGGEVVEVRLSDPNMRIQLPAAAVGDITQYLKPKPSAPVKPSALVGAV